MKIIGTLGQKTYLAAAVEEHGDSLKLHRAIPVNLEATTTEIARYYVKGTITGKVVDVDLTRHNLVSTQEADEIGALVDLMMKYLPLAEKQARANTILPELDAMMRATAPVAPKAT